MNWLEVLVLALLQGATEFLPISSSAHLILAPVLLGWEDQGHAFDVAVHVGTLLAMLSYFRRELGAMLHAVMAGEAPESESARYLAAWLVVATIPIVIVGAVMFSVVSTDLREVQLIAWTTLGFGILLWVADAQGSRARTEEQLRWSDAVWIGSAQCLALVPGVSRGRHRDDGSVGAGSAANRCRTGGFPLGDSDDCCRRGLIPAKIFARDSSSGLGGINPGCLDRWDFRLAVYPLLSALD